jgi:hypothetical protein
VIHENPILCNTIYEIKIIVVPFEKIRLMISAPPTQSNEMNRNFNVGNENGYHTVDGYSKKRWNHHRSPS